MKIILPETHPSINTWGKWHYRKYNNEKIRWSEMIGWICKGKETFKGAVSVRIDWYFSTRRKRDYDNYTPKLIMDGLVDAGIIEDDHSGIVQKLDDHNFHYDKDESRTEIKITSLVQ